RSGACDEGEHLGRSWEMLHAFAERNLPQCHSLGTLSSRQSGTSTTGQTGVLETRSDDRECTAAEGDQALQLRVVPTALVRVPSASHGGLAARPSQSAAKAQAILGWFGYSQADRWRNHRLNRKHAIVLASTMPTCVFVWKPSRMQRAKNFSHEISLS